MPTYTYKCKTNGHIFEKRQKFTDDALTECEVCGEPVRKVINSVGVVFKGKGFYVTDNRSKNSAAPKTNGKSESSSSTASESSSSDSGSSETKKASEPKSESKSTAKSSSADS